MADLSQTATSVAVGTVRKKIGTAGEAITAGMAVYLKASDQRYWKAQHDGTAAEAAAVGIALTSPGAAGNEMIVTDGNGTINIGATLTIGETYAVSATAGAICPNSDVGAADYVTNLGIATTAALLDMQIHVSGVAHG